MEEVPSTSRYRNREVRAISTDRRDGITMFVTVTPGSEGVSEGSASVGSPRMVHIRGVEDVHGVVQLSWRDDIDPAFVLGMRHGAGIRGILRDLESHMDAWMRAWHCSCHGP